MAPFRSSIVERTIRRVLRAAAPRRPLTYPEGALGDKMILMGGNKQVALRGKLISLPRLAKWLSKMGFLADQGIVQSTRLFL